MEQRRFFEAKGEESGEWLVLDGKRHPPRVICKCVGWNAPKNAALIAAALQAYSAELYSKFPFDDSDQLDEQPVVKASGWLASFVYYTEPSPIFDLQILDGIELGGMTRTPWEDRLCIHSPCKPRSCVIC